MNRLDNDSLMTVFSYMDYYDVVLASKTCADWYEAAFGRPSQVALWKWLSLYRWTFCSVKDNNWLAYFIERHRVGKKWEKGRPMTDFKMTPLRGHANYIQKVEMFDQFLARLGVRRSRSPGRFFLILPAIVSKRKWEGGIPRAD